MRMHRYHRPTRSLTTHLAFASLVIFADTALAASRPQVSSATGRLTRGAQINITGSGFGSGPKVILFDDFEGGTVGSPIPLSSPTIGRWTSIDGTPFYYDDNSVSGSRSARVYDIKSRSASRVLLDFPQPATEVYVSFWVRVPPGTRFPGNTSASGVLSTNSSWKFAWLVDNDIQGHSSDICLPTYTGAGNFSLAGNAFSLTHELGSEFWSWNSWMRMSVWVRADPSNPMRAGQYLFQVISEEKGLWSTKGYKSIFAPQTPNPPAYTYMIFPGWIECCNSNTRPVYDDIYVASGPNAQARVEISDAPTYAASKRIALMVPIAWSPSSITVLAAPGPFSPTDTVYLYVTDAWGNVNAAGVPLNSVAGPASLPPTSVPMPPDQLSVH